MRFSTFNTNYFSLYFISSGKGSYCLCFVSVLAEKNNNTCIILKAVEKKDQTKDKGKKPKSLISLLKNLFLNHKFHCFGPIRLY